MKEAVFEVCLEFHQLLIRPKLSLTVQSNAYALLVDGEDLAMLSQPVRNNAKKMAKSIMRREEELRKFKGGGWDEKVEAYKEATGSNPSDESFNALRDFYEEKYKTVGESARRNGVFMQNVSSLKKRFERFELYANKL